MKNIVLGSLLIFLLPSCNVKKVNNLENELEYCNSFSASLEDKIYELQGLVSNYENQLAELDIYLKNSNFNFALIDLDLQSLESRLEDIEDEIDNIDEDSWANAKRNLESDLRFAMNKMRIVRNKFNN